MLLAPDLRPENAEELLAAGPNQSKAGFEQLLARLFPQPAIPPRVLAFPAQRDDGLSSAKRDEPAPGRAALHVRRPKVAPLAPERFALQLTIGQATYEKLQHAQELLGHQFPKGDLAAVLDRALDALIARLEKRKLGATSKPCPRPRSARTGGRYVPAAVRRAVWERDGGRCTFVGESGRCCPARTGLEFDHIEPVALGGEATVGGMRLRCRAHNQHAAECAFGAAFMSHKRREARRATAARAEAAEQAKERDVVPWLRQLGFRADEARRAAERCEIIPDASLEERVRRALSFLSPSP